MSNIFEGAQERVGGLLFKSSSDCVRKPVIDQGLLNPPACARCATVWLRYVRKPVIDHGFVKSKW